MTTRISHWIDNQSQPGVSGRAAPVFNPATGAHTADVDLASSAEVNAAVARAAEAARIAVSPLDGAVRLPGVAAHARG